MNQLDHIVVAARDLQQGVDHVRETLGVDIPAGGKHQAMATHNHLMQLGNDSYLEVIAIDETATVPDYPRWFGLDSERLRAALDERPRFITWVMNTPDLGRLAATAGFDIGTPTALSRDGLSWEIALPDDGRLLGDGMLPYCIQWHSSPHPSRNMADTGCVLRDLTVHHNRPGWLEERLEAIRAGHLVQIEALAENACPYLTATIDTPGGSVILG